MFPAFPSPGPGHSISAFVHINGIMWYMFFCVCLFSLSMFLTFIHVVSGKRNGNPLQYSCLENPVDRGAWWAIVHKVAKSHD